MCFLISLYVIRQATTYSLDAEFSMQKSLAQLCRGESGGIVATPKENCSLSDMNGSDILH